MVQADTHEHLQDMYSHMHNRRTSARKKIETLVTEENLLFCTMYNTLMFYKAYLLVIITLLENRSGNINNYLRFFCCCCSVLPPEQSCVIV